MTSFNPDKSHRSQFWVEDYFCVKQSSGRPTAPALPSPRGASPAMHQRRAHLRRAGCRGPPHEGQDGEGVLRNPHVGPLCVVVLDHYAFILPPLGISLLTLKERQEGMFLSRERAF